MQDRRRARVVDKAGYMNGARSWLPLRQQVRRPRKAVTSPRAPSPSTAALLMGSKRCLDGCKVRGNACFTPRYEHVCKRLSGCKCGIDNLHSRTDDDLKYPRHGQKKKKKTHTLVPRKLDCISRGGNCSSNLPWYHAVQHLTPKCRKEVHIPHQLIPKPSFIVYVQLPPSRWRAGI